MDETKPEYYSVHEELDSKNRQNLKTKVVVTAATTVAARVVLLLQHLLAGGDSDKKFCVIHKLVYV